MSLLLAANADPEARSIEVRGIPSMNQTQEVVRVAYDWQKLPLKPQLWGIRDRTLGSGQR